MLVKIEDENQFKKNIMNNALVNTDVAALTEYKNKKRLSSKVNNLTDEINIMKSDIADIKSLLIKLVNSNSTDK